MSKRILKAVALIIAILLTIAISAFVEIKHLIEQPLSASDTAAVSFTIEAGQGVREIGDNLAKARLINGSDFFKLYLWETKLGGKLKAGSYELSPSMSIPEIVSLFTAGSSGLKSNETRVSLPEGSTNEDILRALKDAGAVPADASFGALSIDENRYAFLADKPASADLQGYLFPDTYNYFKSSTLEDALGKMLDNFGAKVTTQMRADIGTQGKSLEDVLTMASIIEKESPDKTDMPAIASVFYNRLDAGMPLQSDATINYITKAGHASPTQDELETDSAYNTYKHPGLPPAPICNPGLEAIKAAIHPAQTDYFFFLMPQDGSGKTIFSKTFEEHVANKAKYLR